MKPSDKRRENKTCNECGKRIHMRFTILASNPAVLYCVNKKCPKYGHALDFYQNIIE